MNSIYTNASQDLLKDLDSVILYIRNKLEKGSKTIYLQEISTILNNDPLRTKIITSVLVSRGYIRELNNEKENLCNLCKKCVFRKICPLKEFYKKSVKNIKIYIINEEILPKRCD